MNNTQAKSGFIMIMTLMIASLAVVLVTYIINRSIVFVPIAQTMIEREKARELALGGIQLAISQLAYADVKEKEKEEEKKTGAAQPTATPQDAAQAKQFMESIWPYLNRWQIFTFTKAKDGFEGKIAICLMSEEGKIDLNAIYDFNKHAFTGNAQEQIALKGVLKTIFESISKQLGGKDLFGVFEKFLKERQSKIRDVTELLTAKEFEPFKDRMFYEPAEQKTGEGKEALFLTDLFTIWSQNPKVDPWFFSPSLGAALGLKAPAGTVEDRKNKSRELFKEFKPTYTWPADWNKLLGKMYGKEFAALPKGMQSLLETRFGPRVFSVLSYGTVGKITHRLFAILEREREGVDKQQPAAVTIKELYWI